MITPIEIPTARLVSRRGYVALAIPLMVIVLLWVARHVQSVIAASKGQGYSLLVLWLVVFGSLVWHLVLAWTEKTYRTTPEQQAHLAQLKVVVSVPAYNEDPDTLRLVLRGLLEQTRMPQRIHVVDDGSDQVDLSGVRDWFLGLKTDPRYLGIVELLWDRLPENRGKRHAQILAIKAASGYDIIVTTDSDTIAERSAIEEGLKPFADRRVTSVASVILAYNHRAPLVRLTDAWLLTFQLAVRAAMSRLGCVLVNSGNFSLYRAEVLREALDSYEHESFMGRDVQFSDDSLLTLFAHLRGRTVQQPTSFAFTVLPERLSHHLRQQLRWMRGSTIRSLWRFKYLPLNGFAFWEHFAAWVNFVLVTFAFGYLLVFQPLTGASQLVPAMALFALLVALLTSLRYLTIRRSDQRFRAQLGSWAVAPLMLTWTALVLRPLRIYAILTCWKTGWNTRGGIEITLDPTLDTNKELVTA